MQRRSRFGVKRALQFPTLSTQPVHAGADPFWGTGVGTAAFWVTFFSSTTVLPLPGNVLLLSTWIPFVGTCKPGFSYLIGVSTFDTTIEFLNLFLTTENDFSTGHGVKRDSCLPWNGRMNFLFFAFGCFWIWLILPCCIFFPGVREFVARQVSLRQDSYGSSVYLLYWLAG